MLLDSLKSCITDLQVEDCLPVCVWLCVCVCACVRVCVWVVGVCFLCVCVCVCVYWEISQQKFCNDSCFPYKNIKSPISHTPTIYCKNHKALSFNKIAVQWINYVRKCLIQVTSTRTMAYAIFHHRLVLTADKNISWFLEQRVKSCSGRSWLRIRSSSRLLNTEVKEIWCSYGAGYYGHCDEICDWGVWHTAINTWKMLVTRGIILRCPNIQQSFL